MRHKPDNRGISLPLTIGLLLLLIAITATVNELVIKALRSSHQIEASDKAYFAAEAGIENALYELSAHTAGYETPSIGVDPDAREDDFTETVDWTNEWEIKNKALNTCGSWNAYDPDYCGRIYGGQKLVLNLFSDEPAGGVPLNGVSEEDARITTLSVTGITVKFRLPESVVINNPNAFDDGLLIDNDGDLGDSAGWGPEGIIGLNEDGADDTDSCGGAIVLDDGDCDGREDEDSPEDPVILWSLRDGSGHSFQPLRGCKGDPQHPSHDAVRYPPIGHENATLCEKNFVLVGNELAVSLDENDKGVDQNGIIKTLADFLLPYGGSDEMLQMEFLVVAPMEAVSFLDPNPKIPIPYLEYGIDFLPAGLEANVPSTYFSIKSDGYYRDFKQSITTNVVPRATTRLLDLTIIQQ